MITVVNYGLFADFTLQFLLSKFDESNIGINLYRVSQKCGNLYATSELMLTNINYNFLSRRVTKFRNCVNDNSTNFLRLCLALASSMICHMVHVSIRKSQGFTYLGTLKVPGPLPMSKSFW